MSSSRCKQCNEEMGPPIASAPHKQFCKAACRQRWHQERRLRALRQLSQAEQSSTVEIEENLTRELGREH
jgi:hypothetical protein